MIASVPFLDLAFTYRSLQTEIDAAVSSSLASGWYILGPEVESFEREFAAFSAVKHCIGVGSGLDALTLCLKAWGIGPGDEVIVPTHTFIATWLAVTAVGATIVPVEPSAGSFNVDPARVKAAMTPRTRAIVPVHLYGEPAPLGPILDLAQQAKVHVLDDAAQAHGATYDGKRIGGLTEASAWSFYPGKNLGAFGDGGAVTTNDDELAERLRMLRNYGSRRKYENELLGTNSRLDPIQAAILRVKLRHLEAWNGRRRQIARAYDAGLAGLSYLTRPTLAPGSVWHLYVVRVAERARFQAHLADHGVQSLIHYPIPPHRQKAYAEQFGAASFPISEAIHESVVSLPIGPHLSDEQVSTVIAAARSFAPTR